MTPPTLILRADASALMGTGHVMRSLALAEPWFATGSQVILAAQLMPEALGQRALKAGVIPFSINAEGGSLEDAQETIALAEQHPNAWVVVDGYQFGETYFSILKHAGVKVLQVDDFGGLKHYETDFVLNQNLGADLTWYPHRESSTRLLVGTRYVQLRGEFLSRPNQHLPSKQNLTRLLVTLGGSDAEDATSKVIQALQLVKEIEATIVVGGSNPHWDKLQSLVAAHPNLRLVRNATNMPELMADVDFAIAAGGTTVWELAYMGIPMLTVIQADNQVSNAAQLQAAGLAINMGWHTELRPEDLAEQVRRLARDPILRDEMSKRAHTLVDGLGSLRVWLRLNEDSLHLRPATTEDTKLIFDWANDPGVRAVSFSSEAIVWENHVKWFNARLADANYRIWVATDTAGTPLGQVRFQIEGEAAIISLSLDANQRGKNRGSLLIWTASQKLFRELPALQEIHAYIKQDNQASIRAFEKAEFVKQCERDVKGLVAWLYVLRRENIDD